MEFRKYKNTDWSFTQQGKANYKGIAKKVTDKVYINGEFVQLVDILQELFPVEIKQGIKAPDKKINSTKLLHGNTGRKLSDKHIKAIKDKNSKQIEFNGVVYKSVQDAASKLQVSRHTIARRLKLADNI